MTARMHPAYLVLIGVAVALAICVPTTHYVITKVYDNAACVVELQPIQQTREMTVIEWPLTRAEEPIPAPRRSVQRKRQTLIPPSMPAVEQCAPPPGFYGPEPQVQHVPEPSSLPLALAGLAGVFALRRKEGKQ